MLLTVLLGDPYIFTRHKHVLSADVFGSLSRKNLNSVRLLIQKGSFVPESSATAFWRQNGTATQSYLLEV